VFICDVAGHGVRSALVTAMIRALSEELKPLATDPGQFLSKLNRDLYAILKHTGSPMLTTAFLPRGDWNSGVLRYANAGHPKPLHVNRGSSQVSPLVNACGKGQPALGLFEDALYETQRQSSRREIWCSFLPMDCTKFHNAPMSYTTQALLIEGVQRRAQLGAGKLFDDLLEEIRAFSGETGFSDDVCLVGVELAG